VSTDKGPALPSQKDLVDELKKGNVIEKTMLIPSQQEMPIEQIPAVQSPQEPPSQAPAPQQKEQMFEVPLQ